MMQVYEGTCPKCGCDRHYVASASMPTVNECGNCHYFWNPNNEKTSHLSQSTLSNRVLQTPAPGRQTAS